MFQLIMNQAFDAPVAQLYKAWSDLETIKRWFAPGDMTVPEATADVRAGGNYRIVMQATDGSQHIVSGRYHEVIDGEKLVFSWQWEGSPNITQVTILFTAIDENKSALQLIHNEFDDQQTCDKHQQGWNGCITNLLKIVP